MARKTLADIDPRLKSVVEEFHTISEVKHEMASDAYDLQDDETKKVIDRIAATLQLYATGYLHAKVGGMMVPIPVSNDYLGMNLFWLAVEVAKDLAFSDIQLANFEFPPSLCANCGAEVLPGKKVKHRG